MADWFRRRSDPGVGHACPRSLGAALAALLMAAWLLLATACVPYDIQAQADAHWTATALASPPTPVPTATSTPTPRPSPTATPVPTATAVPTPRSAAPLGAAKLDDIAARAAAVRGLPLKQKVPVGNLTREQLQEYLVKSMEKDNGREEMEKGKAVYVLLDLLKEQDDIYQISIDLLTEQVAGFYDFEDREMKVVEAGRDISLLDELTLVHEYVHAAQDQNFNLADAMKKSKDDGEKSLGLRTLAEGDATLAMGLYANRYMTPEQMKALGNQPPSSPGSSKLNAAPPVLQQELLFPYTQGAIFAGALLQRGGLNALNQAYASPPITSEQLIHPDKYLAGEGPKPAAVTDLSDALGSQWSMWDGDSLGEFGLDAYLSAGIPTASARKASTGWGGDRYSLYRSADGKHALAAVIAWDSPQEASEFFQALGELRAARKDRVSLSDGSRLAWSGSGRAGHAGIKGSQVVLAIAPDEGTARKMADKLAGS